MNYLISLQNKTSEVFHYFSLLTLLVILTSGQFHKAKKFVVTNIIFLITNVSNF